MAHNNWMLGTAMAFLLAVDLGAPGLDCARFDVIPVAILPRYNVAYQR